MDTSLILYAEHEFNASTFTARVCASTLSDMHSCVTGAIGSLRGPLHGGANEAAMELIEKFSSPEEASEGVRGMLERKDKIMGFGHAIYRTSDPRNVIIKQWAEKLAADVGDTVLYPVSCAIEKLMWDEKELFANADFFHASAYNAMGIPTKLFTPIFVCSRVLAGLPMLWNNVRTIGSFAQVRTTLAPTRGRLCLSLIGKYGNHRLRSAGVNGSGERERYRPSGCGRCGSCWLGEWSSH